MSLVHISSVIYPNWGNVSWDFKWKSSCCETHNGTATVAQFAQQIPHYESKFTHQLLQFGFKSSGYEMSREALEYFSCFKYGTRDRRSTVRFMNTFLLENPVLQSSHLQLLYFSLRLPSLSASTFFFPAFSLHPHIPPPQFSQKQKKAGFVKNKYPHFRTSSGCVCHLWAPERQLIRRRWEQDSFPHSSFSSGWTVVAVGGCFWSWPPAAGDDSDLRAVRGWGAEVAGGPPLLLTSAAHMEDIPKMERQGLIGRAEVWHAPVVIEQRSAEREKADQITLHVFTQTHNRHFFHVLCY